MFSGVRQALSLLPRRELLKGVKCGSLRQPVHCVGHRASDGFSTTDCAFQFGLRCTPSAADLPSTPSNMTILRRIDRARNMARFYALGVEPTLFGEFALVREWGRIGRV